MIGMLKEIDKVEAGIMECERNGKQIFDLLGQICTFLFMQKKN